MTERKKCENNHKITIDWEKGEIQEHKCTSIATNYTVDKYGIFYLCDECYREDRKRRIRSQYITLKDNV